MNASTDREIDLLYGEIVDLRTLYRAIQSDFAVLRQRFNWTIVASLALTTVVGASRLAEFILSRC
jgi:hypothetical protein